jgi:CubicO group peptidase (beta-lactamase class C family)
MDTHGMAAGRPGVLAVLLVACVIWPATSRAPAQTSSSASDRIDAHVDSVVDSEALNRGVPGVGVVIASGGRVVVQRAYGRADVSTGRAVNAATSFNVASITKPFTAALILQLVAEGRVDLDARARSYLASLPERYDAVTVRQLLTHTSGVARDLRQDNLDDPDEATYRARLATAPAAAAPGARFEYSNAGYTVLGWIVEAIEGRPLDYVLHRRVFAPLSMHQASYRRPLAADPGRARPHEVTGGQPRPGTYVSGGFGSGGISLSIADLAAFAVALQSGRALPASIAHDAWRPARLADGTAVSVQMFGGAASYGLGWFLTRYAGRPMMTHGGAIEGYSANLYHFPDEALTIAVVANVKGRDDGTAPVDPLARRLADFCLAQSACRLDQDRARVRDTLGEINRQFSFAYVSGDRAALGAAYAPGALALAPDGILHAGAERIAGQFRLRPGSHRLFHALYPERLVQHADMAFEQGTWFERTARDQASAALDGSGRYMLAWVRLSSGWRIATDVWMDGDSR